jgi:GGDEF domain-containing protein
MAITPLTLADLTDTTVGGAGYFDSLMRALKAHLEQEYTKDRIKGTEYATVYLGSVEHVLKTAASFLLEKDKSYLEAQILEVKKQIADVELLKAQVEKQKADQELLLLQQQELKVTAEIAVLDAQKCKLDAEFDVLVEQKLKTAQETQLLTWKVTTEKAQTTALGVEDNSVIGKQKLLYAAQTSGFARDAEQKVAEIMVKSWGIRRTTDEATVADGTNKLADTYIGQAITKLLAGVGA